MDGSGRHARRDGLVSGDVEMFVRTIKSAPLGAPLGGSLEEVSDRVCGIVGLDLLKA